MKASKNIVVEIRGRLEREISRHSSATANIQRYGVDEKGNTKKRDRENDYEGENM